MYVMEAKTHLVKRFNLFATNIVLNSWYKTSHVFHYRKYVKFDNALSILGFF